MMANNTEAKEAVKKTILVLFLLIAIMVHSHAQTVRYSYRPLSAEGCTMSFSPTFVGDTAYIVVGMESERLVFNDNPTMMLRFYGTDQVLQLHGKKMDATSTEGAVMVGNIFVPYSSVKSMAMFKVSEQQMEMFKLGVERIRLSTLPTTHDRTFNSDKIGLPLYQNYQIEKRKALDF